MERMHVLIAGGGLSGLCLAHGLRKAGHTCDVFERDPDFSRRTGYMLHMNAYGGEGLRTCLPDDLYELYLETSRRTPERRESIVLSDQLRRAEHAAPPRTAERGPAPAHGRAPPDAAADPARAARRLAAPRQAGVGYEETESGVRLNLADGTTAEGDVLVGADGIRSAIRAQRLPEVSVIDTGIDGIGVFGRSPLTPEVVAELPPLLRQGVIIVADRAGHRLLLGAFQPRQEIAIRPGRDRV